MGRSQYPTKMLGTNLIGVYDWPNRSTQMRSTFYGPREIGSRATGNQTACNVFGPILAVIDGLLLLGA
jgi:hypothetical protein